MCSDGDWIPHVTQANTSCWIWFAEDRKNHNRMCCTERCKGLKICESWQGSRRKKKEKGGISMGSTKRRNRSTERTKEGVSELLLRSVGAYVWAKWVLALGAPWVLAELESSVSQSKQQFWILGFVNDDKETSSLWSGLFGSVVVLGERLVLPRDPSRRVVPPSPGAKGTSCVPGHWCPFAAQSCHCGLSSLTSVTHTSIKINYWLHISTTEPNFQEILQGNLCGLGIFMNSLSVFILLKLFHQSSDWDLFFPRNITLLQLFTVPNNEIIINLNLILWGFCGVVQWFSHDCAPGDFVAGLFFFLCIFSYNKSATDALKTLSNFAIMGAL